MKFIRKDADVSTDNFYIIYFLANVAQFQDISIFLEAVLLDSLLKTSVDLFSLFFTQDQKSRKKGTEGAKKGLKLPSGKPKYLEICLN